MCRDLPSCARAVGTPNRGGSILPILPRQGVGASRHGNAARPGFEGREATPIEVQRLLGITYRRLRSWLDQGIVVASRRSPGRQRRFTARDMRRVRIAARLKRHGATRAQLARYVPGLHEEIERIVELEIALERERVRECAT